jgi:hypothetical protein
MKWQTEMQLRGSSLLDDRRFDALADAVAEVDQADSTVEDTDLAASLADGWVIVAMVVTADDPAEAIRKTVATVRAAIQKIGDATPGWEQITDLAPLSVRPVDSEPIHA